MNFTQLKVRMRKKIMTSLLFTYSLRMKTTNVNEEGFFRYISVDLIVKLIFKNIINVLVKES